MSRQEGLEEQQNIDSELDVSPRIGVEQREATEKSRNRRSLRRALSRNGSTHASELNKEFRFRGSHRVVMLMLGRIVGICRDLRIFCRDNLRS